MVRGEGWGRTGMEETTSLPQVPLPGGGGGGGRGEGGPGGHHSAALGSHQQPHRGGQLLHPEGSQPERVWGGAELHAHPLGHAAGPPVHGHPAHEVWGQPRDPGR